MKCPVCEGSGYEEKSLYAILDCLHCRGTGEIQDGDWWMCAEMGFPSRQFVMYSYGDNWAVWDIVANEWDEYKWTEDIVPLYRVDRVG